jgi:cell division protein FtsL
MMVMSEKKMVSRNIAIALGIICIVLAALLVGTITYYESKISSLNSRITTLQSQVASLEAERDRLQSQVASLSDTISSLEREIDSLKAPQLHEVEVYWKDHHPLFGKPYIEIYGSIFNSGVETAHNVICTVRIYDKYNTILKTEEIHLGNIDGKSYKTFDETIEYSGDADHVTTSLSYG